MRSQKNRFSRLRGTEGSNPPLSSGESVANSIWAKAASPVRGDGPGGHKRSSDQDKTLKASTHTPTASKASLYRRAKCGLGVHVSPHFRAMLPMARVSYVVALTVPG
jgi:hypothetical protein